MQMALICKLQGLYIVYFLEDKSKTGLTRPSNRDSFNFISFFKGVIKKTPQYL